MHLQYAAWGRGVTGLTPSEQSNMRCFSPHDTDFTSLNLISAGVEMIAGVDLDTLSSIDILYNQLHIYIIKKYTSADT